MRTSWLIALFVAVLLAAVVAMPSAAGGGAAVAPVKGVVVYYFHGDVRCATCRKLASGAMSFHAVNVDETPNKHFITDFQLTTKAVVVVEYANGKPVRHTNLNKIWQLVGNKDHFFAYVQAETRAFLKGA